jgi:hypothetical protein
MEKANGRINDLQNQIPHHSKPTTRNDVNANNASFREVQRQQIAPISKSAAISIIRRSREFA